MKIVADYRTRDAQAFGGLSALSSGTLRGSFRHASFLELFAKFRIRGKDGRKKVRGRDLVSMELLCEFRSRGEHAFCLRIKRNFTSRLARRVKTFGRKSGKL